MEREMLTSYNSLSRRHEGFRRDDEVYIDFLPPNPPSRTCIAAAALPGAGTIVEIECIAQA